MSDKLSNSELDVLDGFNRPSIEPNTTPSAPLAVTKVDVAKHDTADSKEQFETILAALQEQLELRKTVDPLTGEDHVTGSTQGNVDNMFDIDDIKALQTRLSELVDDVRTKSTRLKDAIDARQAAAPVEVKYDKKTKTVLRRGMVRVFKHKAGTITYDHYTAAIKARDELSKRMVDSELPDIHTLIKG